MHPAGCARHWAAIDEIAEAGRIDAVVQLVCPAEFDSPLVDETQHLPDTGKLCIDPSVPVMGIDEVTREVIDGIDRGDPLIIPGLLVRLAWLAQRLAPGLMRRFIRRQVASVYHGRGRAPLIRRRCGGT
ncbi:hypothetical protein [Mycobacterium sp. URHB0021]|jgi:3-dehydrosphinganine reductase